MVKKTYISPELVIQLVHTESIIALSKFDDPANKDAEVLVKEEFEGEGNGYRTTTVEWENWEDQEEQQQ